MSDQPTVPIIEEDSRIPLFIVVLHRLARLGRGTRYAPYTRRFVQFDIDPIIASKWVELKDVDRVTLIYKDPTL